MAETRRRPRQKLEVRVQTQDRQLCHPERFDGCSRELQGEAEGLARDEDQYDRERCEGYSGTSNGHGVAYLLGHHKEQLGVKVVDSVTIFESDHLISLCFWIVDEDDGGAALQPAAGPAVRARGLNESSTLSESGSYSGLLPREVYPTWTGALAKRLSKVAEAC